MTSYPQEIKVVHEQEAWQGTPPVILATSSNHGQRHRRRRKLSTFGTILLLAILALSCYSWRVSGLGLFEYSLSLNRARGITFGLGSHVQQFDKLPDFSFLASHCASVSPISASEFRDRQKSLARVMHSLNASAYIAEPGANAAFFGNISLNHWGLSERPLLLIISPSIDNSSSEVDAKVTILTPSFEKTRAMLLPIPSADGASFVEWPEDANPYEIAVSALSQSYGNILVDGSIRKFISDGLANAMPDRKVESAPSAIRQLRERKSSAEIALLRCANEVTVLALRAVRDNTRIGMHESVVRGMMQKALSDAGLQNAFALTLFGENAALPHGSGTGRVLGRKDFVLIDCGGTLHGYHSDITRTYALPESTIPTSHLSLWFTVLTAQSAAHAAALNGTPTHGVDDAARHVISRSGHEHHFTHRLGHGIGLEGHEDPYLRGGSNVLIQIGHTFSNEPGVYVEGEVGVRLEDIFYIDEEGKPVMLTNGVGGQAKTPWDI